MCSARLRLTKVEVAVEGGVVNNGVGGERTLRTTAGVRTANANTKHETRNCNEQSHVVQARAAYSQSASGALSGLGLVDVLNLLLVELNDVVVSGGLSQIQPLGHNWQALGPVIGLLVD